MSNRKNNGVIQYQEKLHGKLMVGFNFDEEAFYTAAERAGKSMDKQTREYNEKNQKFRQTNPIKQGIDSPSRKSS